jgi:hypothetical protein
VPEQNKKLAGFEALYKVDQDRRQQHEAKDTAVVTSVAQEPAPKPERARNKSSKSESNIVSNIVSNITPQQAADVFEPTTFKADRRKVKALKRLALDLEPTRKLQDLFDEALADILTKYGRTIE